MFGFEAVTFKQSINMFDHTEIAEHIYECVVEPYYETKTNGL